MLEITCYECKHVSMSHVLHMEHFKLQHPTMRPHKCTASDCDKTFVKRSNLKRHMITHNLTHGAFMCPQCPREFLYQSSVVSHVRDFHSLPKQSFDCLFEGCKFTTTCAKYLKVHEKVHSLNRPEFRCPKPGCDSTFYFKSSLMKHLKKHDKRSCQFCTELDFTCNFCNAFQTSCHDQEDEDVIGDLF